MPINVRTQSGTLGSFARSEKGSVAVIFGLIAVMFVAIGGMSIDMSRAYGANTRALAAIDAAILAAGQARNQQGLSDTELQALAATYFNQNIQTAGTRINEYSNFQMSITGGGNTFTGTVDVAVPTHFASVVNFNSFNFTASSTATFDQLDLELGLMLDVTGSMNDRPSTGGNSTKLEILKRAVSQDLLDTLVPNQNNDRIKIGYAPYSAAVNAGGFAADVTASGQTPADGCVVERLNNQDSDDAPSAGAYFRGLAEANTTLTSDQGGNGTYNFYACPNAQILPLTTNKQVLSDTINAYTATGRTAGHLGIAWAWYLISPDWASIWGGNSAPKAYGADDLIKAVILLTDGAFNASYGGSDYFGPAETESYTRAAEVCTNMKDKNVLVFAIGFDLDDPDAQDALRNCSSHDPDSGGKLFFPTADENDLRAAFKAIGFRLSNLRLSK